MKPRILVLYYSQSGQLRSILDSITSRIKNDAIIDFAAIQPVEDFPFPWSSYEFFDAMPETVQHIPIAIKPLPASITAQDYDLIIFGFQPWFLNASLPITSFLQSKHAEILRGKPLITVVGCRNMWLHAQEGVKKYLQGLGATLVGNIVLTDRHENLLSVVTIVRWAFTGKKEATRYLPEAGVGSNDIAAASRFGPIILKHIQESSFALLHEALLKEGSINLKPGLVMLEQKGTKNFRFWSAYVREKGGPKDPARKGRLLLFKLLLAVGIFVLSPISSVNAAIQQQIKRRRLERDVAYFKALEYKANKF